MTIAIIIATCDGKILVTVIHYLTELMQTRVCYGFNMILCCLQASLYLVIIYIGLYARSDWSKTHVSSEHKQ